MSDINTQIVFWKPDLKKVVGKSPRTIDRWIQEGKFPKPDKYQDNRPLWTRKTITDWAEA